MQSFKDAEIRERSNFIHVAKGRSRMGLVEAQKAVASLQDLLNVIEVDAQGALCQEIKAKPREERHIVFEAKLGGQNMAMRSGKIEGLPHWIRLELGILD